MRERAVLSQKIASLLPTLSDDALRALCLIAENLDKRPSKIVDLEDRLERAQRDKRAAGDRRDSEGCDRADREIEKVERLLKKACGK